MGAAGLTVVIAEGVGSHGEGENVVSAAGTTAATAALTTTFDVAFARAQADETRGISRDPAFLTRVYERWADALPTIGADVVVDTGALSVEEAVARLREALAQPR